jgi:malate dehydrogenase
LRIEHLLACRFAQAIIKALKGETGIVEPAYVYLPGVPGGEEVAKDLRVDYFAVPIEFNAQGAVKAYPIGKLSAYEEDLLRTAIAELKGNIANGEACIKGAEA